MDSVCGQSAQLCGADIRSKDDFEAFVKRHMKDAYLTALGLVGNREDALELSQEAFFRAYQHYDQLHAKGKFFPWFYQILRNLCFSHLRKRRVRRAPVPWTDSGQRRRAGARDGRSFRPADDRREKRVQGPHLAGDRSARREASRGDHSAAFPQSCPTRRWRKRLFCNRGTVTSRLFYARQRLKEILEGAPQPEVSGLGTQQDSGASDASSAALG